MKSLTILVAALACAGGLRAQTTTTTLVNWNHVWDFMHPMGVLPAGSGATEPNSGATKWYAPQAEFLASYSGPTFGGARVNGVPGTTNSYDSGSGPGPIGYGSMDYTTVIPQNLPTGQFTGLGTTLTTPNTGNRRTGYFRTTFTVPASGSAYINPVISYLLDDGGFVYLDGVPVLRVNMAPAATDAYTSLAAGTANTESHIRFADLSLPVGSTTGGNAFNSTVIAGNATVLQQVLELSPGVHTLAVSLRSDAVGSSDLDLALRMQATEVQSAITATASNIVRNYNGTPYNPTDDRVGFALTASPIGSVSPSGWTIVGPAGSAAVGQTGAYNTPVSISNIPIAEFPVGGLQVVLQDAGNPAATSTVAVYAPGDGRDRVLADWNHVWDFMHPMGVLPAGSGATEPNSGATKWFAAQAEFDASYTGPTFGGPRLNGVPTTLDSYDSGSGAGPIGYGVIDYPTSGRLPTGQFSALSTLLTSPSADNFRTAYFRTTFTVPGENFHVKPVIQYVMDDGGFVYLDGVAVLQVNLAAGAADTYAAFSSNTTDTESYIRYADLSLPVGSVTGGNTVGGQNLAGNAIVLRQIAELSPGVHTLAASVHNGNAASSDIALAMRVVTTETNLTISATASGSMRNPGVDPADPIDDTMDFNLTVAPAGTPGSGWVVTGPPGSAALGLTGLYHVPTTISGIPISEFPPSGLSLTVADLENPSSEAKVAALAPRVIASNSVSTPNATVVTSGTIPSAWVVNEASRTLTMVNGGAGVRKSVSSEAIDLSGVGGFVLFTGVLEVIDTSSGNESGDSFLAELILDGDEGNPINLITRYDTLNSNGVMDDDELAATGGAFLYPLEHYIPDHVNSVRLVISGTNDSNSETFVVRNLQFGVSPPTLLAIPGAITINNQGTVLASDDTYSTTVTITPVNLGASTGWTSNSPPPASGLYSTANPVHFGPYLVSSGPREITLTDNLNNTVTASMSLVPAPPAMNVTTPLNVVRVENGPGVLDDTVTFDVNITGTSTGPGWNAFGAAPSSGPYGPATFTLSDLFGSSATVTLEDQSYIDAFQVLTLNFPNRYLIGEMDLGAGPIPLATSLSASPAPQWVSDPEALTLRMNHGGGGARKMITSQVIDLSSVVGSGVSFSALLQVTDLTSGTEVGDSFVANLILDGDIGNPVNLITSYDTQVVNGVLDNDELAPTGGTFDYPLSYVIPDGVQSVVLEIGGVNDSVNEILLVRDILLSLGPLDSDEDGMTDDYEVANGLNPLDSNDRLLDLDGDGQSNLDEFLAGTAANDASSRLQVTEYSIDKTTGAYSITWKSVPGKNYRIQVSNDLAVPFADLNLTNIPADAGDTTTFSGMMPGVLSESGFMRIRVVP